MARVVTMVDLHGLVRVTFLRGTCVRPPDPRSGEIEISRKANENAKIKPD